MVKHGQYSNRWGACRSAAGRRMRLPTKRRVFLWNWNGLLTYRPGDCCIGDCNGGGGSSSDPSSVTGSSLIGLKLGGPSSLVISSSSSMLIGTGFLFFERGHPVMLRRFLLFFHTFRRFDSLVPVLELPISEAVS